MTTTKQMKIKRAFKISTFVIILGSVLYCLVVPRIFSSSQSELVSINDTSGKDFNPLENIDFKKGNYKAYLHIAQSDLNELPKGIVRSTVLESCSNSDLQDLQREFVFTKSNGDMSTCESEILIFKEETLIFRSNIVITEGVLGLQNNRLGWSDAQNKEALISVFAKFQSSNWMTKLFL